MAEKTSAKKAERKSARSSASTDSFTAAERAAMKERAKELKAEARAKKTREAGERDVREKIAEMPEPDRSMATRLHALITAAAPSLAPKTWYGMPAYARAGKVVVFFQGADKFEVRYATLGFNDTATLDEGTMWPTSFALTELTDENEARIQALVEKAVG